MDYSYYTTAQTPYQFPGFPRASNGPQQSGEPNGWTGTASPPNNQNLDTTFDSFDHVVYGANSFVPPHIQHHRESLQQSPAPSRSPSDSLHNDGRKASLSESNVPANNNGLVVQAVPSDPMGEEGMSRTRSSSEEKDPLTPAQSKRKAQNRAAQRAFRERKERHVKELEVKLNDLEQATTSLREDNERLKRELAKISTQNEILRATSSATGLPTQPARESHSARYDGETMKTGPMKYTPTDFMTAIRNNLSNDSETASITLDAPMADNHHSNSYNESNDITSRPSAAPPNPHVIPHPVPSRLTYSKGSFAPSAHRITISPLTGQRLLSAGATWDYIQAHQLFQDGLVDIADVSERLKGLAQCDGTGPSFEEGRVRRAIEESAEQLKGKDELI